MKISEPIKAQIPVTTGGAGRALGPLAEALAKLEVGLMIEVSGVTNSAVSSAASAAGKREDKKFAVRKLNKIEDGQPVFGIWRMR